MMKFMAFVMVIVVRYAAIALLLGLGVMLLWNACLVGTIAGVGAISYWQGVGISFLTALLFKTNVTTSTSS